MSPDEQNITYWKSTSADQPLAGVHIPEAELWSRVTPDSVVLDYGCGAGALTPFVLERSSHYIGIDVNEVALQRLKQTHPQVQVYETDGYSKLSIPDDSIDVIICSYVLVSVISDVQIAFLLDEFSRVLKSGGYVWIAEAIVSPDYDEQYKAGYKLLGRQNIAVSFDQDGKIKRYIRHFTELEIETIFSAMSKIFGKNVIHTSPSSNKQVNTAVMVFQK